MAKRRPKTKSTTTKRVQFSFEIIVDEGGPIDMLGAALAACLRAAGFSRACVASVAVTDLDALDAVTRN